MSNATNTVSKIMPSAAPTPEELAEWHALPADEQAARLASALEKGFASPAAKNDIDVLIAEAKSELKTSDHG